MFPRVRPLFVSLAAIAYVALAAIRATGSLGAPVTALGFLAPILWVVFRYTESPELTQDAVGSTARRSTRVTATAAALYLMARTATGRAGFDAVAALAVGLGVSAALIGLARVPDARGALGAPPATRRLDAMAATVLIGVVATTLPAAAALFPERGALIDPLSIDYTLGAEAFGALLLLTLASLRFRTMRRLELGVVDRGAVSFLVATTLLVTAAPAAVLRIAPPDRVLPASALLASIATCIAIVVPDAQVLGRSLRVLLVLAIFGAPIALFAASVATSAPEAAGGSVLVAGLALVLVGVFADRIAGRLSPSSARWLGALGDAQKHATLAEPTAALRATMSALRNGLGPQFPSPVLFRLEASDQVTVDRAGYLHEGPASPPPSLVELCEDEIDRTFRLHTARALEVRKPSVRPVHAWMEANGFLAVTCLHDDEGAVGLLAFPKGDRRATLNLAEVAAVGRLTERLASVLALSSALAAARAKLVEAENLAKAASDREALATARLAGQHERVRHLTLRIARPAMLARYSPASRMLENDLARVARETGPVALFAKPGVMVESYAARIHIEGARAGECFLVVDGTLASEQELAMWLDRERSPLSLAHRGTLLVLDVIALPFAIQELLAQASREGVFRSGDGDAVEIDTRLFVSLRETPSALVARDRLHPDLGDVLGDRPVALPTLAARVEDLRAITLEMLARAGLAEGGSPVGLADDALAWLVEHPFPGNDLELSTLLLIAAKRATGGVVTKRHLEETHAHVAAPSPPKSSLALAASAPKRRRSR